MTHAAEVELYSRLVTSEAYGSKLGAAAMPVNASNTAPTWEMSIGERRNRHVALREGSELEARHDAQVVRPSLEAAVQIRVAGFGGGGERAIGEDDLGRGRHNQYNIGHSPALGEGGRDATSKPTTPSHAHPTRGEKCEMPPPTSNPPTPTRPFLPPAAERAEGV